MDILHELSPPMHPSVGQYRSGSYFKRHWGEGTVAGLVAYAKAKMPPDRPGSLTDQNHADLAAFLLDANGYPKGDKALPPDTPSQQAMPLKRGQ
jgi:hypothetical protein